MNQFLETVSVEADVKVEVEVTETMAVETVDAMHQFTALEADYNKFSGALEIMTPDMSDIAVEAFELLLGAPAEVIKGIAVEKDDKEGMFKKAKDAFVAFFNKVKEWFKKQWSKVKAVFASKAKKAVDNQPAITEKINGLDDASKKLFDQVDPKLADVTKIVKGALPDADKDTVTAKAKAIHGALKRSAGARELFYGYETTISDNGFAVAVLSSKNTVHGSKVPDAVKFSDYTKVDIVKGKLRDLNSIGADLDVFIDLIGGKFFDEKLKNISDVIKTTTDKKELAELKDKLKIVTVFKDGVITLNKEAITAINDAGKAADALAKLEK